MTLPKGLDHIDIVVDDVAQMRGFFEAIGFTLIRETDHGGGAVELRFPGAGDQPILELTPRVGADGTLRPLGLRHMALRVTDIEATLAAYSQQGLHPAKPPRVVPETGRRLANIIDPAGNALQFVEG